MPIVKGTHGNFVTFEVVGINEAINYIMKKGVMISNAVDLELVKLGNYMEGEVKASVAGQRAEPKSVDTGHFINNIQMRMENKGEVIVSAPGTPYDVYLEYGTRFMAPRFHFRNSLERNKTFIIQKMQEAVNNATK